MQAECERLVLPALGGRIGHRPGQMRKACAVHPHDLAHGLAHAGLVEPGLRTRNWLHNRAWFMTLTHKIAGDRSAGITLPDYEQRVAAG